MDIDLINDMEFSSLFPYIKPVVPVVLKESLPRLKKQFNNFRGSKEEISADVFTLGYYLPWILVARSIDPEIIASNPNVVSDIDYCETFMLVSSDKLELGINKKYIYEISFRPNVELYSLTNILNDKHMNINTFILGYLLSCSNIMFEENDNDVSIQYLEMALSYAKDLQIPEAGNIKHLITIAHNHNTNNEKLKISINAFVIEFIEKYVK